MSRKLCITKHVKVICVPYGVGVRVCEAANKLGAGLADMATRAGNIYRNVQRRNTAFENLPSQACKNLQNFVP